MKPHEPHPFPVFNDENESKNDDITITGAKLKHRFTPHGNATVWLIDYQPPKGGKLTIATGNYLLLTVPENASGTISCATRMCTLPEHPAVATVEALSQSGTRNHIWVQPIVCTLCDVLKNLKKLSPGQTSWLAEQLAEGLEYLHQEGMGYDGFAPQTCAFTAELGAVLLPPQVDTRGLKEQNIHEQIQADLQSFASLLWLCLTGEKAPQQEQRLPLNVVLPAVSATTAQLFEKALDRVEDAPSPVELALALKQDVAPEVLPLHLAAPPATRGMIKPLEHAPTREMSEKTSRQRTPISSGKAQKISRLNKKKVRLRKKKQPPILAAIIAVLLVGGAIIAVGSFRSQPEHFATATETQTEHEAEPVAIEKSEEDTVIEMVQTSLEIRNQALASGQPDTVVGYAVVGSAAEKNDKDVIAQNVGNPLKAQLLLDEIHEYSLNNDIYRVLATVKSDRPLELQENNDSVYMQDGVPHQKVEMIFQRTSDGWLLMQATPYAQN